MAITLLVNAGESLSAKDDSGETPLHVAVRMERVEAVRLLLDMGADPNIANPWRETPLSAALLNDRYEVNLDIIKALMDHKADPSKIVWNEKAAFIGGSTEYDALKLLAQSDTQFLQSEGNLFPMLLKHGQERSVVLLLENCVPNKAQRNLYILSGNKRLQEATERISYCTTGTLHDAMYMAISVNDVPQVRKLLESGASPGSASSNTDTLLMTAVAKNRPEAFRLLLDHGADINAQTREGRTALHMAVIHSRPDMARLLMQNGIDPGIEDEDGRTAMDYALSQEKEDILAVMVEMGQSWEYAELRQKFRSLYDLQEKVGEFMLLIRDAGFDVNAADENGQTLLHWAVRKTAGGHTVQRLVELGLDPNREDKAGNAPIHRAIVMNAEWLVDSLLKNGAKLDGYDYAHNLLILAMYNKRYKIATMLVERGVDPNVTNEYSITALHIAAGLGQEKLVEALLAAGADVNAVAVNGMTPLFAGARHSLKLVKMLVKAGADVNVRDEDGNTAEDIARNRGNRDVYDYLMTQ